MQAVAEPLPAVHSWHRQRMVALDLETTSPDPELARIVTASVVIVGGGQPTEEYTLLARPDVPIPQGATAVHGITNEHAAQHGMNPAVVIGAVAEMLEYGLAADASRALVVFNAAYDLTVLDREARRYGLRQALTPLRAYVVDPLVIDKHLDKYRPSDLASHKLEDVCRLYGVVLNDTHSSAADALAAAKCAWMIAEKGKVVRRTRGHDELVEAVMLRDNWWTVRHDLRALHAAQRGWYTAQAADFERYLNELLVEEDPDAPYRQTSRTWPVAPLR